MVLKFQGRPLDAILFLPLDVFTFVDYKSVL